MAGLPPPWAARQARVPWQELVKRLLQTAAELGSSDVPLDADHVEAIRRTSQALVKLDGRYGGADVFPLALRVFRAAHRRIGSGAYPAGLERDLLAATGEAGEVAAWVAYDADRQDASRQIILEALLLSRQAGDRDMELFELSHLAMQSVHLRRPAEALRVVAEALGKGKPSARVAALFGIRQGRAFAQLGDGQRAIAALCRARDTLADGVGARDPYWTWWVDEAEVMWHTGVAYGELGEWGRAVPLLAEVAERRAAYPRARYNDLTYLLDALGRVADWRAAEPVAIDLAGQVGEIGSVRTTNLLRRVVARIPNRGATTTVADVAEHIRRVIDGEDAPGTHTDAVVP